MPSYGTCFTCFCVKLRHDLVHRNGKTKDGNFIVITEKQINEALVTIKGFIQELSNRIAALKDDEFPLPFFRQMCTRVSHL